MAKKSIEDDLVSRTLAVKRESKRIEFKETFDSESAGDWCEIIKDLVAIANSGGGCIGFGLDNHGKPVKSEMKSLGSIDPAIVIDRIAKYTGTQLADLEIAVAKKSNIPVIIWKIPRVDVPMVFINPGTYADGSGKQKNSFSRGTLYFRHGAKSEPAIQQDLRDAIDRKLEQVRREWLKGLQKVTEAPDGYKVHVLPPEVVITDQPTGTAIRLTDDPSAPAFFKLTPDKSHPFRQKELVDEVNKRLPKGVRINQYDVQAVRKVHNVDVKETFTYHPMFGSSQYSPALVDWLVRQFENDNHFFEDTRLQFYNKKQLAK